MERLPMSSNAVYCYYYPLLERYARRMVKDAVGAAVLAGEVLQEQFIENGLTTTPSLRKTLLIAINFRCHYWVQARVFDKELVKVPFTDTDNDATKDKSLFL